MNDASNCLAQLYILADAQCEGMLTAAQMSQLEELVIGSEELRYHYILHTSIHALAEIGRCGLPNELDLQRTNAVESPVEYSSCGDPSSPPSVIVPGSLSNALYGTVSYFSEGMPLAYLLATMILGFGLLIGSRIYVSDPEQVARDLLPVTKGNATHDPQMLLVGRISGMVDCQWADPRTEAFNGAHVPLGRKYALTSGLMEITYDTGANVILQGPVTYEVESATGGFLSVGKLTARIDKKAGSGKRKVEQFNPRSPIPNPLFVVRTPTATVTDIGTEFGVEVDEKEVTEVQVFVGKVRTVPTSKGGGEPQLLGANQTARIEGGKTILGIIPLQPEPSDKQFVRTLPRRMPTANAYAELVLLMQPVLYYRMERPTNEREQGVLFDSAEGSHHGTVHLGTATGQLWPLGRFGDALHLRGPMVGDYAVVSDFPQSKTNQLTVAAWVFAEARPPWATIAKNWGDAAAGQFHFGMARDGEDLHVFVCQKDGTRIELREGPSNPLPVNAWQHVAMVVDGTMAHLYRNGEEVGAVPCSGLQYPASVPSLAIGCKLDNDGVNPDATNPGFWRGRIDELAIFHRALPPDTIRQLYLISPTETTTNGGRKTAD